MQSTYSDINFIGGTRVRNFGLEEMTTQEITALASVKEGRMIYNTTIDSVVIYDGEKWLTHDELPQVTVVQLDDTLPTTNDYYLFAGMPTGGYPTGFTGGEIGMLSNNVWVVIYSAAMLPETKLSIDGKLWVKNTNGNGWEVYADLNDEKTTSKNVWSAAQISAYVTQQLLNMPSLPAAHFATTTNDTLSGLAARDGYTPVAGNIALVKNQTNTDNGVWITSSGAWTRAKYNATTKAFEPITTETKYSDLNVNSGIVNVLNGTTNKNLQFQITIVNKDAAFGGTTVYVTQTTKIPLAGNNNKYVDNTVGNNSFNGSFAYPFATLTYALNSAGLQFPANIMLPASGSALTDALTFTAAKSNVAIQTIDSSAVAGKTSITGVQTYATGNTRVGFKGTTHNTGVAVPFVFESGNLFRHWLENVAIITTNTSLMTLPTNATNWLTIRNIDVTSSPFASIVLPAFTSAFTFNIYEQISRLPFTGTGAASTVINIIDCEEGLVRIAPTYLGAINWQGDEFGATVGSVSLPRGIITSQSQLDTVLTYTTDTNYDGYYVISGFTPTANKFENGAIFGKQTAGGFTEVWWGRKALQSSPNVRTVSGETLYYVNGAWRFTPVVYPYDKTKAYAKDDVFTFNGKLYQASADITANTTFSATTCILLNEFVVDGLASTQQYLTQWIVSNSTGSLLVNVASPTGITGLEQGDIIYNDGTTTYIIAKFVNSPVTVNVNVSGSVRMYVKSGTWWVPYHEGLSLTKSNYTASGSIGDAAFTVDIYGNIIITQTTANIELTLPTPNIISWHRTFRVNNSKNSTQSIKVDTVTIENGNYTEFFWNGSAWNLSASASATLGLGQTAEYGSYIITARDTTGDYGLTLDKGNNLSVSNSKYVTLKANKTYELKASLSLRCTYAEYQFKTDADVAVGSLGWSGSVNSTDPGVPTSAYAVYTPSVDTRVKLVLNLLNGTLTTNAGSGEVSIKQIGTTASSQFVGVLSNEWNIANSYPSGTIVVKDSMLYQANAAIPAGTPFTINTTGATWKLLNQQQAEYGEATLPSSYTATTTLSDLGLSVTLPSAGVWEIEYVIRAGNPATTLDYLTATVTDASNTVVTNSEIIVGPMATNEQQTSTGVVRVSTNGANTVYKVRVKTMSNNIPVFSDPVGKSSIKYKKISGFLPVTQNKVFTETLTIKATTTDPTKPTVREIDYITLVDDDTGWCTVNFNLFASSTAGATAGSGMYLFSLPAGYQFDTTTHRLHSSSTDTTLPDYLAVSKIIPGSHGMVSWSSPHAQQLGIVPYSATQFRLVGLTGYTSGLTMWSLIGGGYFQMNSSSNLTYEGSFRFKKQ